MKSTALVASFAECTNVLISLIETTLPNSANSFVWLASAKISLNFSCFDKYPTAVGTRAVSRICKSRTLSTNSNAVFFSVSVLRTSLMNALKSKSLNVSIPNFWNNS